MVLLVIIGRAQDGLLLCYSSLKAGEIQGNSNEYQNQAKHLFKRLGPNSPTRVSIDSGPYIFHYLLENGICYLGLCEKSFSARAAFTFLEEMSTEFQQKYGNKLYQATRPYSFIEFDTDIQESKKKLNATRSRRNINMLASDLQEVQRVCIQNIGDVALRGAAISELDSKASNLSLMSQQYKKGARMLNTRATYAKVVAGSIIVLCFILYFWVL